MPRRLRVDPAEALRAAGVVAAVVLALAVNILAARHFTRWDWTKDGRWSLSPGTLETLRGLGASPAQPLDVWVIAGPGDPLEPSLRPLFTQYRAASSQIDVHFIDPDRDAVQLADLERRFGLEAGRTEDGRVAADAIIVVARGDKHWFLTPGDLFQQTDDVHVTPHEERAITQAIRSVIGGDKAKLCFTVGHGELSLEPGRDEREWLGSLRDLLEKSNYTLASVDTTAPDAHEPFAGCDVAVVAGPRAPFGPGEANRLRAYLLQGGSLFAAIGPIESNSATGMAPAGLDEVLAPFGIALEDDVVHDVDGPAAIADTHGEGFFASVRPHPTTASLVGEGPAARPPRVALFFARSLRHAEGGDGAWGSEVLATSSTAFAKKSLVGASSWTDAPPRDANDPRGPFTVAMASERPRVGPSAPHGPRAVVIGSRFALAEDNWRQPHALHGTAFFVDSAISWLAARPSVVDVPERADVPATIRVSQEGRDEVRTYVLLLMPLAAALLGVAVWAWRRSLENKPYEPHIAARS